MTQDIEHKETQATEWFWNQELWWKKVFIQNWLNLNLDLNKAFKMLSLEHRTTIPKLTNRREWLLPRLLSKRSLDKPNPILTKERQVMTTLLSLNSWLWCKTTKILTRLELTSEVHLAKSPILLWPARWFHSSRWGKQEMAAPLETKAWPLVV